MTRSYAARRLLALGPLTRREFNEITGWTEKDAHNTLRSLREAGFVKHSGSRQRGSWSLANR